MSVVDLMLGRVTFVVGVEPDRFEPAVVRIYVGHRSDGLFFYVTGDDADEALRVWNGSTGHVTLALDTIPNLMCEGSTR